MPVIAAVNGNDPRFQGGAYITDGIGLYEVIEVVRVPMTMSAPSVRLTVENCRTMGRLQFPLAKITTGFQLVRAAPSAPDLIPEEA